MCLILEGDDARRFHKYMEDPDCTVRGLILILEAMLISKTLSPIEEIRARQRLNILKERDKDEIIYVSQFKEVFGE